MLGKNKISRVVIDIAEYLSEMTPEMKEASDQESRWHCLKILDHLGYREPMDIDKATIFALLVYSRANSTTCYSAWGYYRDCTRNQMKLAC